MEEQEGLGLKMFFKVVGEKLGKLAILKPVKGSITSSSQEMHLLSE